MKRIDIKQVTDSKDNLSDKAKSTFLYPDKIKVWEILPNDHIWRFIKQKNSAKFGGYWLDGDDMTTLMRTFWQNIGYFPSNHEKQKRVKKALAVLDVWSHMSWRVKAEFKKPIIAYKGATAPQERWEEIEEPLKIVKKKKKHYSKLIGKGAEKLVDRKPGGLTQYVIPRFFDKGLCKGDSNEFATVGHFAML